MLKHIHFGALVLLMMALGLAGCGKSESTDSGRSDSSAGGSSASGGSAMEREARNAAMAEVQKHWLKRPDGWVMVRVGGAPMAPDKYLEQFKDIVVEGVEAYNLSESDKLNGFEWAGEVQFKKQPYREVGDPGIVAEGIVGFIQRNRGQWSQWVDYTPFPMKVQKVKGQWQINPDTTLLRGMLPTPADFQQAGVK